LDVTIFQKNGLTTSFTQWPWWSQIWPHFWPHVENNIQNCNVVWTLDV